MVSYVEQAILRVKDESTGPIKKINRELKDLFRAARAARDIKIDIKGLAQAEREVRNLSSALRGLPRSRTLSLNTKGIKEARDDLKSLDGKNINARITLTGITQALRQTRELRQELDRLNGMTARPKVIMPPRGGTTPTGGNTGIGPQRPKTFNAGLTSGFNPAQIGRDMARSFTIGISQELYQLAARTAKAAAVAPLDREGALRRLELSGVNESGRSSVERVAEEVARGVKGVPATVLIAESPEVLGRIDNLESEEGQAELRKTLQRMAETVAIIRANDPTGITPEQAAEQARQFEKALSVVNQESVTAGDPIGAAQQQEMVQALRQAFIATGGDISFAEMKRAMQQIAGLGDAAGAATALFVALNRDENSQRGTAELRQVFQDLTRDSLSNADTGAQIDQGLRNKDGSSAVDMKFQEDFLGAVGTEIIPRLEKLGVDLTSASEVRAAVDKELGFSAQGAIAAITETVNNYDKLVKEQARAQQTTPEAAFTNQTTREEFAELQANFDDLAVKALSPLLPTVKGALATLSGSLERIGTGEAGATDYAAAAAAAVPVALGAGLTAMLDPATRPLGASAIALTGSAVALDGAAAALTAAAALQGVSGAGGADVGGDGKKTGRGGRLSGLGALALGGGSLIAAEIGSWLDSALDSFKSSPGTEESAKNVLKQLETRRDELQAKPEPLVEIGPLPKSWTDLFRAITNAEVPGMAADKDPLRPADVGPRIETLTTALSSLNQQIADFKAGEAATGVPDPRLPVAEEDKAAISMELTELKAVDAQRASDFSTSAATFDSVFGTNAATMQATFSTGATQLNTVGTTISAAATAFGPLAGSGLVASAAAFGAQAAAAFNSAVGPIGVTVNSETRETPRLDTGAATPF